MLPSFQFSELFQSRSGFSLCFDDAVVGVVVLHGWVSIPLWVFSLLRRADLPGSALYDSPFQSRSGFSLCFDEQLAETSDPRWAVSIPLWVFSLLRLPDEGANNPATHGFQSRSGFSLCFDATAPSLRNVTVTGFQSRSGFSLCFDVFIDVRLVLFLQRFNPALGFLFASTGHGRQPRRTTDGFNPALGFLSASTGEIVDRGEGIVGVSIPLWVFSLLRQQEASEARQQVLDVSIPLWVFSLLRLRVSPASRSRSTTFQSRSGFSLCFDAGWSASG